MEILKKISVNGTDVEFYVRVDDDSDIELFVECDNRLVDPSSLFVPVFEDLGLDLSLLDKLVLREELGYYQ